MSSNSTSSGVYGDFEHPNEALRRSVKIALVFSFLCPTVAVALRVWARKLSGCKLFLDDYLILIALFFKYACSIGVTILLFNGMGSHIDMVPKKKLIVYFQIGWANPFMYTTCVAFTKLSILALYKRLFTVKPMTIAVNIMASFVVLWCVSIMVAATLNCIPINSFWDRSIDGKCIDAASFNYAMQIPNIFSDLIILVMPIRLVLALPIPKTQKILLSGVFLIGGLTLIFDTVRLWVMIRLTKQGPDITFNQAPVAMWTCLEGAVAIVGACLPNLRPLFRFSARGFWSQLRSSRASSKAHLNSNTTNTTATTITMNTTSSSGDHNISKPVFNTHVSDEGTQGIEIHRYSKYMDCEK
ncbi:integral membrane protein [Penicillium verhagenii]|nr:integral membrane protein [Penicillium verhagenii]